MAHGPAHLQTAKRRARIRVRLHDSEESHAMSDATPRGNVYSSETRQVKRKPVTGESAPGSQLQYRQEIHSEMNRRDLLRVGRMALLNFPTDCLVHIRLGTCATGLLSGDRQRPRQA